MSASSAKAFIQGLHQLEDLILATLLIAMILLACSQIVLRNVIGESLLWADPLGRIMLLWLGLLGALAAARKNRHIAIDLVGHYIPDNFKNLLSRFIALLTAGMCGLLAWHTARFVLMEFEVPTELVLGIPSWLPPLIIPLSFGLMALRYLLHTLIGFESEETPA